MEERHAHEGCQFESDGSPNKINGHVAQVGWRRTPIRSRLRVRGPPCLQKNNFFINEKNYIFAI